jgi:hypothetical protein
VEKWQKEIDVGKIKVNEGGCQVWRREVVLWWWHGFRRLCSSL